METWLNKVGPYDVEHVKCRQYAGAADMRAARCGVLHTTEGNGLPLGEFRQHYAPHFLVSKDHVMQLIPIGTSGASMRAHNNQAFIQIELVGFSKERPWFPDIESARRLAAVMATCHLLFSIPLTRPWKDGDWGKAGSNPHRGAGIFGRVPGWYGHGDVPSPDVHWDPGNLSWSKLFDMAKTFEPEQPAHTEELTGHAH